MSIDKAIKQTKGFKDERKRAVINVMYTGNWLVGHVNDLLKPHKLNDQHYNILRILKGRYPDYISPGQVKEVLLNKRGDLTRLVDKLVKMELVNRCNNDENRRVVNLSITEKGLQLIEDLELEYEMSEKHENKLTEEEAKTLNILLDKMRE
ncbi:MarR family winged helix-turn-helix transcriptional regulator [Aureibacter tunicatorum]|uniref:DNA-binding MarR family transcriptional regulator n=1 Tax=Aureibacter tunicatorum TaxID=866807 RepID=A0AAE4BT06_9BACT|nr:MarR family transcriptional regulator [Aureibacter tunicatorum]MDR6240326.1 DNA-binding MarR family transcriptional regulator [Aureibacter tunicatorum]BDD05793.1 MarR family transcriptional regulator [Aureibacter tunicatorum]